MSTRSVTADNVMLLLHEVVKAQGGDYKDPNAEDGVGCVYADKEKARASCIVGRVFELAGMTFEEISALDSCGTIADVALVRIYMLTDNEQFITEDMEDALPSDFEIDLHSLAVLKAAQRDQDHGNEWAYALASASMVDRVLNHGGYPLVYLNLEELIG